MTDRSMSLAPGSPDATGRESLQWSLMARLFLPLAAIVFLTIAVQICLGVNPDTSYSLTEAEKMLDGQRPYVDFLELNPPLLFLLAVPPTLVARLTGATPELLIDLFCFVAAGLSISVSCSILIRGRAARAVGAQFFAIMAAGALLLLPMDAFAQREHIALIAALPCLTALVVWSARGQVTPVFSILAGLGAGVAISIKPHFALFFLPTLPYLTQRIGWRSVVVRLEPYVALAIFALFSISTIVWFPGFLEHAVPMVRDIYVPVRQPVTELLRDPTFIDWVALIALLALAARDRWAEPLIAVPTLSSVGAMAVYLIQGKLWPSQGYPAIALAALALGPLVLESLTKLRKAHDAKMQVMTAVAFAIAVLLSGYCLSSGADEPELERVVAAIGPHPKVLAISPFVQTGHPLTRTVHGVWVGSVGSLWITDMTLRAFEGSSIDASRREAYSRLDREMLVADIVNHKPDAILIGGKTWLAWSQSHPEVAAALADYHWRATAHGVRVYSRNDAEAPMGSSQ